MTSRRDFVWSLVTRANLALYGVMMVTAGVVAMVYYSSFLGWPQWVLTGVGVLFIILALFAAADSLGGWRQLGKRYATPSQYHERELTFDRVCEPRRSVLSVRT